MLIRALIVVLAIFNAGVALWWWSQPPVTDAPVPVMSPPEGVALLQLRSEVPVLAADAAAQDNALASHKAQVLAYRERYGVSQTAGDTTAR